MQGLGLRLWALGFRAERFRFRVQGLCFDVSGFLKVSGSASGNINYVPKF